MENYDLTSLSVAELKALQVDLEAALVARKVADKKRARAAAEAVANAAGFTLNELVGASKPARQRAPAKYRHPENSSVTWSGRGRPPKWFKEVIEAGSSEADLLI